MIKSPVGSPIKEKDPKINVLTEHKLVGVMKKEEADRVQFYLVKQVLVKGSKYPKRWENVRSLGILISKRSCYQLLFIIYRFFQKNR